MRNFRRGSRPSRARSTLRRKTDWLRQGYSGTASGNTKYTDWMILPGSQNSVQPAGTSVQMTPDVTLVRSVCDLTAMAALSVSTAGIFQVGLIAWDSPTTSAPLPADAPNLFDDGFDWVWRADIGFPKSTGGAFTLAQHTDTDSGRISRAMRKLPAGTGLLIVVDNSYAEDVQFVFWGNYLVKLPV